MSAAAFSKSQTSSSGEVGKRCGRWMWDGTPNGGILCLLLGWAYIHGSSSLASQGFQRRTGVSTSTSISPKTTTHGLLRGLFAPLYLAADYFISLTGCLQPFPRYANPESSSKGCGGSHHQIRISQLTLSGTAGLQARSLRSATLLS